MTPKTLDRIGWAFLAFMVGLGLAVFVLEVAHNKVMESKLDRIMERIDRGQ